MDQVIIQKWMHAMKISLKDLILISLLSSSFSVISGSKPDLEGASRLRFSAYAGAVWPKASSSGIYLIDETDTLNVSAHPKDVSWGVGASYRWLTPDTYLFNVSDVSLGLDLVSFKTQQQGQIWLYNDPAFFNYTYNLNISSWRVMANSEWTFQPLASLFQHHSAIYPFIDLGIGMARNTMSYSDTPLPEIGGSGLLISERRQSQFAWDAGLGLKLPFALKHHTFEASLRYVYADLGKATTAALGNLRLAAPLTADLSTQTLMFGLSALI